MELLDHASEENQSTGAEDGFTTCRTQPGDRNRAKLGAVGKKVVRRGVYYALICEENDDRVAGGIGNDGVPEGEDDVGAAAPRLGSKETPEDMPVVGRNVLGGSSGASPERIRSENITIEAFLDRPREKREGSQMPE